MPVSQGGERLDRRGHRARGGNNHGRAGGAIAALLLLAAMLCAAPVARAQDANPLVQRNVPAEATAENAVVARDRALAAGQRIAYERMAAQLGLPATASDRQIESAVASLVIESERITPRGYSARITVNFRQPGSGGSPAAPAAPAAGEGEAAAAAGGHSIASMEATARYRSLAEYLEITRRLGAAPAVARVELLGIAGDAARFRLALRSLPPLAAEELAGAGLVVGAAEGAASGGGWRLGLAGGR